MTWQSGSGSNGYVREADLKKKKNISRYLCLMVVDLQTSWALQENPQNKKKNSWK